MHSCCINVVLKWWHMLRSCCTTVAFMVYYCCTKVVAHVARLLHSCCTNHACMLYLSSNHVALTWWHMLWQSASASVSARAAYRARGGCSGGTVSAWEGDEARRGCVGFGYGGFQDLGMCVRACVRALGLCGIGVRSWVLGLGV
jgi:hypothetical protein